MRTKHRNDYNGGKQGWVSGNPRYSGSFNSGISRKGFRTEERRETAKLIRAARAEK